MGEGFGEFVELVRETAGLPARRLEFFRGFVGRRVKYCTSEECWVGRLAGVEPTLQLIAIETVDEAGRRLVAWLPFNSDEFELYVYEESEG